MILSALLLRILEHFRKSLRAKFIVVIVALEIALMGAITLVVERDQRHAILEQAQLRALAAGANLAAFSEVYLRSYSFVHLEQVAEKVTANDDDVLYAVVYLHDGKVAAYTGRNDLQGRVLTDLVSQRALKAERPLTQEIIMPQTGEPGYDVAIPVYAPSSSQKWGTIRLGFSLKRAYTRIHQTRRDLLILSLVAIGGGTLLAVFLATRISRPISQLVVGVHHVASGAYDRPIQVRASDEIGYLAHAFEQMRQSLQRHLAQLAEEKERLEETNGRLRDMQDHLVQSERLAAVGKLAARVAHEINNPLAIIKTAIHLTRTQDDVGGASTGHLETIEEEITRIARILRDLLDFSRPDPAAESAELNVVIRSLERLLVPNLHAKQIGLEVVLDPDVSAVQMSADHVKQVLLNLVRNAEDAMPEGGRLVIETARVGAGVEVRTTDTGCGIPPEHLPYLFDPFFTTKSHQGGVGLGLSVIYGLIKNARGRIEVDSNVGKGSTFLVHLPACDA